MPRTASPRRQLGIRVPEPMHQALRSLSEQSGVPINRLVTDAIAALLRDRTGQEA